jgi:anti-anti-sigma factor
MKTEAVKEANATVLKVSGRLDNVTALEFDTACDKVLRQGTTLVLDFSDLAYISSAGLRSVLLAGKKFKAKEGRVLICGLNKMVKDVFHISGFTGMFPVYENREEALANAEYP